jgi:hypothetical protein
MHGLRDLRGKVDRSGRKEQARRLLNLSHCVSKKDDLQVICGDVDVRVQSETPGIWTASGMAELVTSHLFAGAYSSH